MSEIPKIKIEMTPTGKSNLYPQFAKEMEDRVDLIKESFKVPTRLLIAGSGNSMGKTLAMQLADLHKEMRDFPPCVIIDSLSDLEERTIMAFKRLSKTGLTAADAVKALTQSIPKPQRESHQNEGLSYGRQQAQFWANKPTHKLKRRL